MESPTTSQPRIALYVRISRDQEGRAEGVAAQEARGRAYAAERWPDAAVIVFADNDLSASNGGHRPGFEALRQAIDRGEVDHLWVVEQSRLERSEVGWFALAAELDAAGITEVHTERGGIVRVHDEVAGIMAVINAGEARRIKKRTRDRKADLAHEGRPFGSKQFGYRPAVDAEGRKTLEIDPVQADAARWAADAILSGWSLIGVARELEARGVPTARGGTWNENTVRRILTKPSISGERVHHGEIIGRATWQAIIDPETRVQVERVLNGRARTRQRSRRRHLLTGGLAVCGRCGAPLGAQQRKVSSTRVAPYYQCPQPSRGGCSRIGIIAEPFEQHVVDELLDELDKPEFLDALASDEHEAERARIAAELDAVDARRSELARMVAARDMSTDEWRAARAVLDRDQDRLSAALAAVPPPAVDVDPGVIRNGWQAMTLDERQQTIKLFVDRVVVRPAGAGKKRFDASRVEIVWRTT